MYALTFGHIVKVTRDDNRILIIEKLLRLPFEVYELRDLIDPLFLVALLGFEMCLSENDVFVRSFDRFELAVDEDVTRVWIEAGHFSIFTKILVLLPENSTSRYSIGLHPKVSFIAPLFEPVADLFISVDLRQPDKVGVNV